MDGLVNAGRKSKSAATPYKPRNGSDNGDGGLLPGVNLKSCRSHFGNNGPFADCRVLDNWAHKRPFDIREGFRAPLGVRKSPRTEPAGGKR